MKPSALAVLRLLREAGSDGVTTGEFLRAGHGRFGARLGELGILGFEIETEQEARSRFRYTLTFDPDAETGEVAVPPTPLVDLGAEPFSAPNGVAAPDPSPTAEGESEDRDRLALFDLGEVPARPGLFDVDEAA